MRSAQRAAVRGLHRWVAPRKALVSFFADYGPKGCRGERREAGIQWIQPPKAVSDPEFRQTTSGTHGSANRADCLPQGKHPACINKRQLCRKKFPLVGIDAPTPAREKGLQPYGALYCFGRRTEGGAGGRAESHPASMTKDNFAVSNSPWRGMTRRLGADWDWPSHGALTLFFRWRKKSVQKKASGTATPGKSPLLPIFERGSSQCRAQHSWTANMDVRARSCSLFSSFKKGKAFSLRCLSPLCSPAVGGGHTHPLQGGMLRCVLGFFAAQRQKEFAPPQSAWGKLTLCKVGCFGVV